MKMPELVDRLNNYLVKDYGYLDGIHPNWRIVWSDDQTEKRISHYSDEGLELLTPRIAELPKYKQWIHQKYVLERLFEVPDKTDLLEKLSYEPVFVFADKDDFFLPPNYDVCRIVIGAVYKAAAASIGAKYKDPRMNYKEEDIERLKKLQEDLFGNETRTTDALAHGSGIQVPHNYKDN